MACDCIRGPNELFYFLFFLGNIQTFRYVCPGEDFSLLSKRTSNKLVYNSIYGNLIKFMCIHYFVMYCNNFIFSHVHFVDGTALSIYIDNVYLQIQSQSHRTLTILFVERTMSDNMAVESDASNIYIQPTMFSMANKATTKWWKMKNELEIASNIGSSHRYRNNQISKFLCQIFQWKFMRFFLLLLLLRIIVRHFLSFRSVSLVCYWHIYIYSCGSRFVVVLYTLQRANSSRLVSSVPQWFDMCVCVCGSLSVWRWKLKIAGKYDWETWAWVSEWVSEHLPIQTILLQALNSSSSSSSPPKHKEGMEQKCK